VVITLESNEKYQITDDDVLRENSGKVLIVKEMLTETSFNGNYNTLTVYQ
jgi:ACT domain-containing protein